MEINFGDVRLSILMRVPGLRRYGVRWHIGPTVDSNPADRTIKPPPYGPTPGKVDLTMDLMADKKVTLSIQWTDEVGNAVDAPADAAATYTVDDPTVINLTDNGDGTAVAAATGTLGTANVHADVTGGGMTLSGDLQIVVVAGLAERVNVVAGAPEEVTPDVV